MLANSFDYDVICSALAAVSRRSYKRFDPIVPRTLAVPAHAPAALRFAKPQRQVIPEYPF